MKFCLTIILLCISLLAVYAQRNTPANDLIALPEGTVYKQLPNGLHYVVKQNDIPGRKVEFRLILRAGSILQTDNEGGLAHFLEHMAFNGTKNFPDKGIVEYLESLGVKYGFGINAFTGFDRTIYMFSMPTDRPEELDKGLLILKDWLTGIEMNPDQVEREKGVILEEARGYDTGDLFYDLKVGKTRYSQRMPLGTAEEIKSMTADKLNGFYRKWYVPELATVVVIGDLKVAEMEQKIKKLFGDIPSGKLKGYKQYPLDYKESIVCQKLKDTLINRSTLELIIPKVTKVQATYGDRVQKMKERLLVAAINARFTALNMRVSLSDDWYLSDKDHLVLSVSGDNDKEIKCRVTEAVNVLKQIREQGFYEQELARLKENAVQKLSRIYAVKSSDQWCEDFTDLAISGERYVTDTLHNAWLAAQLNRVESRELQKLVSQWFAGWKKIRAAYHYNPGRAAELSEEDILVALKEGEKNPYKEYEYVAKEREEREQVEIPDFLTRKFTQAHLSVASERKIEGLEVKEICLTNGARIILKCTKDGERQITLTAFAKGGASVLPPEKYSQLEGVAGYMEMGGIEKMDYDAYNEMLSQESMAFSVTFEPYWHGWMAMAPADKATELCRLVYEKCFYPEKRYDDFEEVKKEMLENMGEETVLSKMLKNAPDRQMSARIDELMGNALVNGSMADSREEVEAMNLDSIADFYRQIYTNPNGLVCVACGNFDMAEVERDLVAMLSMFPAQEKPNDWVLPDFTYPKGGFREIFPNANEGQTIFDYLYYGSYEASLRNSLMLKLVRDVVRNRLLSVLREQESLLYSPYMLLYHKGLPRAGYYFDINASVDTKNMGKVDKLLKEIIRDVQENEIDAEELAALQRSFVVTRREVVNDYTTAEWKKYLTGALRDGETLDDLAQYDEILYSITPADLKEACCKYLNMENSGLLMMQGEDK